ncbi:heme-binding protein soul3 [Pristis pectinata]|uniref:heme-binding protein soul3 n=1 Tax=Pristis pectinata TaxID=685728 RepID=UPI00223DF682|nr:heme-binding protein soul3 [Pristis pectinata]XP_051893057.1 heme-binding protein soul3 [Pristis pectinata]
MEGQGRTAERGERSRRFLITLEDLDSVSDDMDSEMVNHNNEDEENEQDDGDLFAYWQDVGRCHQVDVPRDMEEPIQQMTRNNQSQERQAVPFTSLGHKTKADEPLYEKRQYEKAKWACVTQNEPRYEQSICMGFMKLMKYICQQNSSGLYLGMTLPIVTIVHTNHSRLELLPGVTIAYYLPPQFQDQVPQPFDTDIAIEEWPAHVIYTRSFNGTTNEEVILREINNLANHLDSPELFLQDTFIVAGYNNPAAPNRHNEIWFIQRP